MKKIQVCILSFIMVFVLASGTGFAAPDITAQSAVLIEAETGRVLYEKNAQNKMPMASTTKIMTALLAIENGDLGDTVEVSSNASGTEGSSIWLEVGEHMTLEDMLYGLMLASGNDAAVAVAEHIASDVQRFAGLMNQKAKEIGAVNTNFVNPNGLHDELHYTTAYDLGIISAYAMQNPVFREIVDTEYKEISWEGHKWNRVVKNKNKILWLYEGCNGIKTGYTKNAGRCLCSSAKRGDLQVVAVVLNAGDMFGDSMQLLDYAFENYSMETLVEADAYVGTVNIDNGVYDTIDVYTEEEIRYPLSIDEKSNVKIKTYLEKDIKAPVVRGQTLGRVDVWIGGEKLSETVLKADRTIIRNSFGYNLFRILDQWTGHFAR